MGQWMENQGNVKNVINKCINEREIYENGKMYE